MPTTAVPRRLHRQVADRAGGPRRGSPWARSTSMPPVPTRRVALWDDTPREPVDADQRPTQPAARGRRGPELTFVARVGSAPRVHAPGRFSYGNAGWSVLDLLLRRRAGVGFEERATEVLAQLLPAGPGGTWRPGSARRTQPRDRTPWSGTAWSTEVPAPRRRGRLRGRLAVVGERGPAARLGVAPARAAPRLVGRVPPASRSRGPAPRRHGLRRLGPRLGALGPR